MILCSTYDAGDLPPEVATSGARGLSQQGASGADTLRRLWERARQRNEFRLGLTLPTPTGTEPRTCDPFPTSDSHRTVPPMAPSRSAMLT